ncbi:MAG TPA: fumarylacetoacetate hydrolase family protein [Acidimicrobiales bacterium]|nr:fumarylacetoacetate hydrolase family protein [Acidimicrobiales bacterium]
MDIDGTEVVATIDDDRAIPVGEGGQDALVAIAASGERPDPIGDPVPLERVRVLAPVGQPPSIRDYMAFEAHARDSRPDRHVDPGWYEHPIFYFSNPSVVRGPDDEIRPPIGTRCLDYELEVACVIGREATDLDPSDPATLSVIAGFTILNDWSARDVQTKEMKQNIGPIKGKDFATSIGPWLVTPDELEGFATGRPKARMQARVNGETWSDGNLGDIHFSWPELLSFASQDSRLLPGDVLGSGTVGTGCILELRTCGLRDTRHWLRDGDVVELEVDGIGVLRNRIVAR